MTYLMTSFLAWCHARPWLALFVIWPLVTGLLNLVLANEKRERAWVAAHPRAALVLALLDGAGLNPWTMLRALADWWSKRKPPVVPLAMFFVVALVLTGCSATGPACTPESLARINSDYVSAVWFKCKSAASTPDWRANCPEYPKLRADYEQRRDAWVRCQ